MRCKGKEIFNAVQIKRGLLRFSTKEQEGTALNDKRQTENVMVADNDC